ncbi:MAG TPA: HEAT repeat domain-containing protein, partial [Sphingomicrobium sp.]|nr:HEAT repeat domain-containing protein [Sphingomicrobium sp.]
ADLARGLLSDDRWVKELIRSAGDELRRDPFFVPHFPAINSDINSGLLVFDDEDLSIAAGVAGASQVAAKKHSAARGSISFTGQIDLLRIVKGAGVELSFWEAPRIDADFTASEAGRCVRTGSRQLRDGELLVVDGRHQSYVIEHAASDLLVLQASVKRDRAPLSVEYDAVTREFVGCSATDDGASRIQLITTLLRKMNCDEAFEVIAEFLDDPHFFVRWHVMRELLGFDAVAALPHLCRLASGDPHPEVRRAAGAVLARIRLQNPALGKAA